MRSLLQKSLFAATVLFGSLVAFGARADESADKSAPATPDRDKRISDLEAQIAAMKEQLSSLESDHKFTEERVQTLLPLKGKISGYFDFGFFMVAGNGTGIRSDLGHQAFPQWADPTSGAVGKKLVPDSWTFMGDPLATAINSRGEPSDTGESRAVTFDPVKNGGKPSFIVNALSFALFEGIGENFQLDAIFDLVPRGRDVSDPNGKFLGDFLDVKLAFAEYRIPALWKGAALALYAGKIESVLGIEYRTQEAVDRIGVAPSLICRYTCGRPLGVKARLKLLTADGEKETLVVAAAITNGSSFIEGFPFHDEVDHNSMKTGSARISYRLPVGRALEIGASGAYGAQDLQTDNSVTQWHLGVDAHLEWGDLDLRGEYVNGHANGRTEREDSPCDLAPCIKYQGAYGQLAYRVSNGYMPYYRVDWRDALHESGQSFVYISRLMRMTTGMHFELGTSVIVKAEYTLIRWLGGIPQFPAHVATSSMIVKF